MGKLAIKSDTKRQRGKIRKAEAAHVQRSVPGRMGPLPERVRHAAQVLRQEAEYRGAINHRVLSPLEVYLHRRAISTRQYNAGQAFYADWAFGICGAQDNDGGGCGGAGDGMSVARLLSIESYQGALKLLDVEQRDLVMDVCCQEVTVAELAARSKQPPEAVMLRLRQALTRIGERYGMLPEISTETLRITLRLAVQFRQAPDGTIEIITVNGIAVGLKARDEVEAMKLAQGWANDWARTRLNVVKNRNARA